MLATGWGQVVYPVVVVDVYGISCRVLLDTGAGSSYSSAALISKTEQKARPKRVKENRNDDDVVRR